MIELIKLTVLKIALIFLLSIPLIMAIVEAISVYKQWKRDNEKGDE